MSRIEADLLCELIGVNYLSFLIPNSLSNSHFLHRSLSVEVNLTKLNAYA